MTRFHLYAAIPILLVAGFVFLSAYGAWNRRRREKETLRSIARSLGFTFSEPESRSAFVRLIGDWEMRGRYNGVPVRVYGERVTGQQHTTEVTFIDATAECRTRCQLAITRETTLSRIGGGLGMQDITTGNEDLDRRVVIKGVPIHIVQRITSNTRLQRELLRLFENEGTLHVDLKGVHYRQGTVFTDEQVLRARLEAMTRTVSALEEATA